MYISLCTTGVAGGCITLHKESNAVQLVAQGFLIKGILSCQVRAGLELQLFQRSASAHAAQIQRITVFAEWERGFFNFHPWLVWV